MDQQKPVSEAPKKRQAMPVIPGYQLLSILGRGGMATVYLAIQLSFGRKVALKVILPQLQDSQDFDARFQAEAHMVAAISHPNIVTVYDVGALPHAHYIAMEYHPNGHLGDRIKNKSLTPQTTLEICRDLASTLAFAHKKGIVHRDIKPDNVLFSEHGTPILTDFGIARDLTLERNLTQVGSAVGTPKYMSPEQARGLKVDGRSDLYSLGVMMYEMLSGQPPFDSADTIALAMKHCKEAPPPLPHHLSQYQPVIDRLLKKDPNNRFMSGDDLSLVLTTILNRQAQARENPTALPEVFDELPQKRQPENATLEKEKTPESMDQRYRITDASTGRFFWTQLSQTIEFNADDYDTFNKLFQRASDHIRLWQKKNGKKANTVHFAVEAHPWIHKRVLDKFTADYSAGNGYGDFTKQGTVTLHLFDAMNLVGRKFLISDKGARLGKK